MSFGTAGSSKIMPTTLNSGKILMYLSPSTLWAVVGRISGHMLGPSLLQTRSIAPSSSSGQTVAAYAARLPPLEWPPTITFAQVALLPSARCSRIRFSRYSAADLSADVTWKLRLRFSRQPTSVPSVPLKETNICPVGR